MSLLSKWKDDGFLDDDTFQKLEKFTDLLIQWNSRINLTGLKSRDQIEETLIGESVLAARAFPLKGSRVADFGSGAGIPGLIWAIVEPSIHLTSVEIRTKKVAFQKEIARQLGLEVKVLQGQFPFVVRKEKFDVIVTRAVHFDDTLLKESAALLHPSGSVLRFASSNAREKGWQPIPLSEKSSLLIFTP